MSTINWQVVPIERWPGESTRNRKRSPFEASWTSTTSLLARELRQLGAKDVLLQLQVTRDEIRQDGWIRANARPSAPGVILTFESRKLGMTLSYPCDAFHDWQANVRAIALGLEALRKVERYGITRRAEQYQGWAKLPPAGGSTTAPEIVQRGRDLIEQHGSSRAALFATHPDHGGNAEDFRAVQAARGR